MIMGKFCQWQQIRGLHGRAGITMVIADEPLTHAAISCCCYCFLSFVIVSIFKGQDKPVGGLILNSLPMEENSNSIRRAAKRNGH